MGESGEVLIEIFMNIDVFQILLHIGKSFGIKQAQSDGLEGANVFF